MWKAIIDFITDFFGTWIEPLYYIAYWGAGLIGVLASKEMAYSDKKFLFFKKPTPLGWSFIFLIFFAFFLSFAKENQQNRESADFKKQLLKSESERKDADAKYSSKLEDIDKGLIRRDTVWLKQLDKWGLKLQDSIIVRKDETLPTLTIMPKPTLSQINPNQENAFSYELFSFNADAHILAYQYILINSKKFIPVDSPYVFGGKNLNQTSIIPKDKGAGMMVFLDRNEGGIFKRTDTIYLAIEYYYKSNAGKRLPPLRKIYFIMLGSNKRIIEADNNTFYEISMLLKKYKIWPKFYDL